MMVRICQMKAECWFFKAAVSPNWSPFSSSEALQESGNCFSFWAETRDIAPAAHFNASSFLPDAPNTDGINDGFSCPLYNKMLFHTEPESMAWVRADLSSTKWVERVVIQTSGYFPKEKWPTYFADVEVRVGNNTGDGGNFTKNELLMYYGGFDYKFELIITFKRENPLLGRYVSVQHLGHYYPLVFMEMKIKEMA